MTAGTARLRQVVRSPWLGAALVILVAALLRYPALTIVPPGLSFDEAGGGVAAREVWDGAYRIWWPIGGGKEPLIAYVTQPFLLVFGFTSLALRACTATFGILTVLGTWWLARELFGEDEDAPGNRAGGWLPVLAGLGLATAFWHVAYSRIAFRALTMPAVEALAVAWLWRALRRSEALGRDAAAWQHFVGAGALIGLGTYTYLAARFLPLALLLFFAGEAILARRRGRRALLVRHFRGLGLAAGVAILVFLPLLIFFVQQPALFLDRAATVSIFNPAWNQGDFWGTLLRTTGATLGTFAGLTGDPNPFGNLPGRPMLGLALAPFFWLGVAVAVWRVARSSTPATPGSPADPSPAGTPAFAPSEDVAPFEDYAPYLLLLCWWPVMLLPGILAPEGAPHHLRIIGTAPATYVLVALGLTQLFKISKSARWLPILIFLPIGLVTARDYFQIWARLPELYMAYDVYAVELAEQMARESDPGVVYVIPMDQRAGHEARHYTLDFLKQGGAPYDYVPVDEATAAARLTEAAQDHRTFRVVRWLQDKHTAADEREVVSYLLARGAQPAGEETYPAYRIETWTLPSTPARFALPTIEDGVGAVFGEVLRLEAADVSADERQVFVALRWAPLAGMPVDYKASLRLVAPDGRVAAQKDRYLRHNWHQGTSLWPAETVNEYYVLPVEEPGVYDVRVVVYHPETLAPLPVQREAEVSLGAVRIE